MPKTTVNTAINFHKTEILHRGIQGMLQDLLAALVFEVEGDFISLVDHALNDKDNCYQFILTIKKLDSTNDSHDKQP